MTTAPPFDHDLAEPDELPTPPRRRVQIRTPEPGPLTDAELEDARLWADTCPRCGDCQARAFVTKRGTVRRRHDDDCAFAPHRLAVR